MINSSLLVSGSRVEVLVCTTLFVLASSFLLVARRWSETIYTSVVAAVAAGPAVVVAVATGGLDACSAKLLAKFGNSNLKIGKVLKGNEYLCMGGSVGGGEVTIGRSESCN